MKALFILNDPPYGTERVYNGLRLADALLKKEPQTEVTIFLMADLVIAAKAGQKTPDGYYNVERMLKRVLAANGKVAPPARSLLRPPQTKCPNTHSDRGTATGTTMRLIMRPVLLASACQRKNLQQRVLVRLDFLQSVSLNAGTNTGHQPARLAHLNHHNECTFLVEISERSAQVVCADGCC